MRTVRRRNLHCQLLEDRRLLAGFGTPWPDARSLTISFPSDEAAIGAYSNSIRHTFDQVADRKEWQEAVLRAFQTWAVETNINIGLTTDRGDHFGAVGLSYGDPRFGDIRVGAFPQQGVLANALPYQTGAGTWSGDVLLNTQSNYFLGDWQSDSPIEPPEANEKGPAVELFSVLLHEAGNALGLADVNLPGSVRHRVYEGPKGELAESDVRAIRELYGGSRIDIYETSTNDRRRRATPISYPPSYSGQEPVVVSGSLNNRNDVDYYRFRPLDGQEKLTVRLRAAGISLLQSHLFVLDSRGDVIADAKADDVFENDLELEIGSLQDHRELFVEVRGNRDDLFSIGDYRIELDYRPRELQPELTPIRYDADADDDDDDTFVFDRDELVDVIFSRFGLIDTEQGANDSLATATPLESTPGFLPGTRYETQAALSNQDVDHYSFVTPRAVAGAVRIRIDTVGLETPLLHADVLDSLGNRVPARVTPRPDGSVSFELIEPQPSTRYFVRTRIAADSPVTSGNYLVTIDSATETAEVTPLLDGAVAAGSEAWAPIRAYKTQLFRLDLRAAASNRETGLAVAIYDSRTATIVHSFSVASGQSVTDFVWLQQGDYNLRIEALRRDPAATGNVSFSLAADGISDDQGPLPIDPTDPYGGVDWVPDPYGGAGPDLVPLPDPYGGTNPYLPGPAGTVDPYGGFAPLEPAPEEDPWYFDPYYEYYDQYYDPFTYG